MRLIDFGVRGDHIALDSLLKATGLAPSGGIAKSMIARGLVQVDGRAELRKTCKVRAGQTVQFTDSRIRLLAAGGDAA